VREFKNIHTSHIFDVRFDVGRIVRWGFSALCLLGVADEYILQHVARPKDCCLGFCIWARSLTFRLISAWRPIIVTLYEYDIYFLGYLDFLGVARREGG